MATPGAHPMTEKLRIPNVHAGRFRSDKAAPTEEEPRQIIAGYLADPDEWWEDFDSSRATILGLR